MQDFFCGGGGGKLCNLLPRGHNPSGLCQGSVPDWLLKTWSFYLQSLAHMHNAKHLPKPFLPTIALELGIPGSGFGFAQSCCVSQSLIMGDTGSVNEIGGSVHITLDFANWLTPYHVSENQTIKLTILTNYSQHCTLK